MDLDSKGVRAQSTREAQKPIARPAWFQLPPGSEAPPYRAPGYSKPLRKVFKPGAGKLRAGATPFTVNVGYAPWQRASF